MIWAGLENFIYLLIYLFLQNDGPVPGSRDLSRDTVVYLSTHTSSISAMWLNVRSNSFFICDRNPINPSVVRSSEIRQKFVQIAQSPEWPRHWHSRLHPRRWHPRLHPRNCIYILRVGLASHLIKPNRRCFGVPLGQMGCRLVPQPDLPSRNHCVRFVPLSICYLLRIYMYWVEEN